jgi:hypothetical protein
VTGGRTWQKWAAAAGCIPGIGGRTANLFSDRSPSGTLPTGVAVIEVADSASIAESIVMVNVPLKPANYVYKLTMDLL